MQLLRIFLEGVKPAQQDRETTRIIVNRIIWLDVPQDGRKGHECLP